MTFGESAINFGGVLLIIVVLIVWAVIAVKKENQKIALMSPDDRQVYLKQKAIEQVEQAENRASFHHGPKNVHILCPHCQARGQVRTKQVKQKVGISGAKATGALLTGGLSILATGLSRKQQVTVATCGSCSSTWQF